MPLFLDNNDEKECWIRFKAGDDEAFRQFFDKYSDKLFSFGKTICKDRELVKDCIQDLFISIWVSRDRLSDVQSPKYYLLISLRRLIFKKLNIKEVISIDELNNIDLTAHEPNNETLLEQKEDTLAKSKLLNKVMAVLPARQKQAIYLRYYLELNYDEISDIMKVNYQVVRNLVYRGLQNIRKGNVSTIAILIIIHYVKIFL